MKAHLQLDGPLPRAASHAHEMAAAGIDGAFTSVRRTVQALTSAPPNRAR
jgi:hypothetical protein